MTLILLLIMSIQFTGPCPVDLPDPCENGANYPDAYYCEIYWVCTDGELSQNDCQAGYLFNNNEGSCRPAADGDLTCETHCIIPPTTTAPLTTPDDDTTTSGLYRSTTEQIQTATPDYCNPSRYCVTGDLAPDPDDCSFYLRCVHGEWERRNCSLGTYFTPGYVTCVGPEDADCINCTISTGPTHEPPTAS